MITKKHIIIDCFIYCQLCECCYLTGTQQWQNTRIKLLFKTSILFSKQQHWQTLRKGQIHLLLTLCKYLCIFWLLTDIGYLSQRKFTFPPDGYCPKQGLVFLTIMRVSLNFRSLTGIEIPKVILFFTPLSKTLLSLSKRMWN